MCIRDSVMVNKPEKYADKVERKAANIKAPKLSWREVYGGKQKRRATAAARAVMEMNAYWAKHPLTLPATNTDSAKLDTYLPRWKSYQWGQVVRWLD